MKFTLIKNREWSESVLAFSIMKFGLRTESVLRRLAFHYHLFYYNNVVLLELFLYEVGTSLSLLS